MIFKYSVSVLLLLFVAANCDEDPITYLMDFEGLVSTLAKSNCTKQGLMCDGCYNVYYCIKMPNSIDWVQTSVGKCGTDETCVKETGQCTKEDNPSCDKSVEVYEGTCNGIGFFPDPFKCNKYYLCSPKPVEITTVTPVGTKNVTDGGNNAVNKAADDSPSYIRTPFECLAGFGYDPLTTTCSVVLGAKGCSMPILPCKMMGLHALESNPQMFYICMPAILPGGGRYYSPQFYYCAANYKFVNGMCVDPTQQLNVENGKCTAKGSFASPECNKFIDCTAIGANPLTRSCAFGNKYNSKTKTCIPMTCS